MDLVDANDFLAWCRGHGIGPDERYSEPRCLVYTERPRHARFWDVPARAAQVPHFVAHLLAGGGDWSHCQVWPRGGAWPRDDVRLPAAEDGPGDCVRGIILGAAGVPPGYRGAVRFGREELGQLIAVLFAQVVFGWTVSDDLFVVPDHGRLFLHTDHHDVVHVEYAGEGAVGPFIEHMARGKYALPEELPDETFKRPDWMS